MTIKCLTEHLLFARFCALGRDYRMSKKESLTQELTNWKSKEAMLTAICRTHAVGKCRCYRGRGGERLLPQKGRSGDKTSLPAAPPCRSCSGHSVTCPFSV